MTDDNHSDKSALRERMNQQAAGDEGDAKHDTEIHTASDTSDELPQAAVEQANDRELQQAEAASEGESSDVKDATDEGSESTGANVVRTEADLRGGVIG